jgi:acyl carrier protein
MAVSKDDVARRVKEVTGRVLNVDPAKIQPGDTFAGDLGAESIQSIELVAAFEEEFGIEMDEDEALAVTSVGKAVDFIHDACVKQHGSN